MKKLLLIMMFGVLIACSKDAEAGHSQGNGTCSDDKIHYQNMYKKRTDAPLWDQSVAIRDQANAAQDTAKCEELYEEALRMIRRDSEGNYPTE